MEHAILKLNKNDDLEISNKIDDLLLEIYLFMPSSGSYPFTMIRIEPKESNGLSTTPKLLNCARILILKRTDFGLADLINYVMHSKEYSYLTPDQQEASLKNYRLSYQDKDSLNRWTQQIIGLVTGIIIRLARQKEINLLPVQEHLPELESNIGFESQHLQAYQLLLATPLK